jgi:hypothetical protein
MMIAMRRYVKVLVEHGDVDEKLLLKNHIHVRARARFERFPSGLLKPVFALHTLRWL